MSWRRVLWGILGAVALFVVFGAGWIYALPEAPAIGPAAPIAQAETDATVAALKPTRRQRPVIAIIGINDATETTDYLMPYGILRRADVADVVALATAPGPVQLYPALKVEPQATVKEFDARTPDGADYVIVPAMSRDDEPAVLDWLRSQSAKGAIIIGVCAGAKIVGAAGLLDGKRGTTHWYFREDLRESRPSMRYVADRRFVVDKGVATTTGISASMPMSLTLIEAIAGREKAQGVARDLGLGNWDARHRSEAFSFTRPFASTAARNVLAFWGHETLGVELTPGMDEVSLALVADAWSRTFRSEAVTFAGAGGAIESRTGMRILPDRIAASWPAERLVTAVGMRKPAIALDETLKDIQQRYGSPTADLVATQLEYPRQSAAQ